MTNVHNTLYVTTQGAYLRRDHESVVVRIEKKNVLAVPLHHLAGIVCFGRVSVSPGLMAAFGAAGKAISFLAPSGRFLARVEGPAAGSVLLRRLQHRAADDGGKTLGFARAFVAGKLANARLLLLRGAREQPDAEATVCLEQAAEALRTRLRLLDGAQSLDALRGHEGEAATVYFGAFDRLLKQQRDSFLFIRRSRRPPLDRINALLSFLYALVVHDTMSALAAVGLDPAVGYLHADRPGRPSLALDVAEEFRPALADRLAVALINLGQVRPQGFEESEGGAVSMADGTRRLVIAAYQKRKQEEITHPFTNEKATVGLAIHVQARLLARAIRGDLDAYPPFVVK